MMPGSSKNEEGLISRQFREIEAHRNLFAAKLSAENEVDAIIGKGLRILNEQGKCRKMANGDILFLRTEDMHALPGQEYGSPLMRENLGALSAALSKVKQLNLRTTSGFSTYGKRFYIPGNPKPQHYEEFRVGLGEFAELCHTYKVPLREDLQERVNAMQPPSTSRMQR